jgi:2-polyprenyl-3-methyl-5-hydroxy-6-metoxy-1,4-benzoquinol methylase
MLEQLLRESLGGVRAKTILDVGPGYAEFSRIAARITGATHITFLDFDEKVLAWQIDRCRASSIEASPWLERLDTADPVSFSPRFDIIHCQEVLEHLPNSERLLETLATLLNPGGRMIITVPTAISERWLKRINPSYMRDDPHGHVRLFDRKSLTEAIQGAGLRILSFVPTQPHYFLSHTWLFGTRMAIEASTGRILTRGLRGLVLGHLTSLSRGFFRLTGGRMWGRILPRNYFVVATKDPS